METLHATSNIMPMWLSQKMADELLGYDTAGTTPNNKIAYSHKSGDYPCPPYDGELHAKVFGFANGVYLGLTINSSFASATGLKDTVLNAFDAVNW